MKMIFLVAIAICILVVPVQPLMVRLIPVAGEGPLVVEWSMKNDGRERVAILPWLTPMGPWAEGSLHSDIFVFSALNGSALPIALGYRAKLSSVLHLASVADVIDLEVGEEVSMVIDFAEHFEFPEPGRFELEYSAPLVQLEQPLAFPTTVRVKDQTVIIVKSNSLQLVVDADSWWPAKTAEHPSKTKTQRSISSCSSVNAAALGSTSSGIIGNTVSGVSQCYQNLQSVGSDSRFLTWFGTSSGLNAVLYYFNKVYNLYASGQANYICENCSPGIFAYVYPSDNTYTVHLCNALAFSGTNIMSQWDSVPGVLLHEGSHFFGTQDYGYGYTWCQTAANTCRNTGVNCSYPCNNADCMEYYCENFMS